MYSRYFVLVTKSFFAIYTIDAKRYSEKFLKNISSVNVVEDFELEQYLLKKVGRNRLIKSGFRMYIDFNKIFYV